LYAVISSYNHDNHKQTKRSVFPFKNKWSNDEEEEDAKRKQMNFVQQMLSSETTLPRFFWDLFVIISALLNGAILPWSFAFDTVSMQLIVALDIVFFFDILLHCWQLHHDIPNNCYTIKRDFSYLLVCFSMFDDLFLFVL
jgi:hypothetical protein